MEWKYIKYKGNSTEYKYKKKSEYKMKTWEKQRFSILNWSVFVVLLQDFGHCDILDPIPWEGKSSSKIYKLLSMSK